VEAGLGLTGKGVVVTGGANGIGKGCVLAFAREGARVVSIDIDEDASTSLPKETEAFAGEVAPVIGDVSDVDVLRRVARQMADTGTVDVVVNNVGGLLGHAPRPSLDVDEDEWRDVVDFNLRPTFLGCKVFSQAMIDTGTPGSIINIGASLALRAAPQLAAYAAAKAGVISLTQTLALELAPHRIRVNSVAPIYTDTPATQRYSSGERRDQSEATIPLGRVAQPEDMAGVVLFLGSHLSQFVTGQSILVDGGLLSTTLRPPRTRAGTAP
jgi:NAD(P)-dependent dehydrogenase (short-subunit alcohol dehydrogenase family)